MTVIDIDKPKAKKKTVRKKKIESIADIKIKATPKNTVISVILNEKQMKNLDFMIKEVQRYTKRCTITRSSLIKGILHGNTLTDIKKVARLCDKYV